MECAVNELKQTDNVTSPRAKLSHIANCFNILNAITTQLLTAQKTNNKPNSGVQASFGADISLPIFIYCVIQTGPPHLISTLRFIRKFRFKYKRDNTDPVAFRYALSSYEIATEFLQNLSLDRLSLPSNVDVQDLLPFSQREVCSQTDWPYAEKLVKRRLAIATKNQNLNQNQNRSVCQQQFNSETTATDLLELSSTQTNETQNFTSEMACQTTTSEAGPTHFSDNTFDNTNVLFLQQWNPQFVGPLDPEFLLSHPTELQQFLEDHKELMKLYTRASQAEIESSRGGLMGATSQVKGKVAVQSPSQYNESPSMEMVCVNPVKSVESCEEGRERAASTEVPLISFD